MGMLVANLGNHAGQAVGLVESVSVYLIDSTDYRVGISGVSE